MKKKKILLITFLIFIICLVTIVVLISFSYGWFQKDIEIGKEQIFKTGKFAITFSNSNSVTLDNTYPMSDKAGNTLEPNKITIKNNGDYYSCFSISINDDENTFDRNLIKYSINKQVNDLSNQNILLLGGVPKKSINSFDIRFWLNKNATLDNSKLKTYRAHLNVNAESCASSLGSKIFKNNQILKEDTNNKGLYDIKTEYGSSYVFKGNVDNNYVLFHGKLFRIIRINEDGTIRIISTSSIGNTTFGTDFNNTSLLESNVYKDLESFYKNTLKSDEKIANSSFETKFKVSENENLSYNNYAKVYSSYKSSLDYKNQVTAKVGLISYDEAYFAGLRVDDNKSYLTNIATWTLSRSGFDKNNVKMWVIDKTIKSVTSDNLVDIHPVISLNANVKVTGNGTKDKPYKVE